MRLPSTLHSLYLVFASIWWGWTILVDMFVVRILFSKIDDVFIAGTIGMELFSKLNHLELIISTGLVAITFIQVQSKKRQIIDFSLGLIVWSISMFYFSYLTPKLIYLTGLWKKTDSLGIYSIAGIPDIQQEHQFYHNLYIGLDSMKLLTLTLMIGISIWKRERWE